MLTVWRARGWQKNSWMLLSVPLITFGLGTWQVKRKEWKEALIEAMDKRTTAAPVALPADIDGVRDLDYHRVFVVRQNDDKYSSSEV